MIPLSDENPTLRTPFMTYALIAATVAAWVFIQGAGVGGGQYDGGRGAVAVGLQPADRDHAPAAEASHVCRSSLWLRN